MAQKVLDSTEIKDLELRNQITRIPWKSFIDYGSVKIQVRNGKPVLITVEKTVRIDS